MVHLSTSIPRLSVDTLEHAYRSSSRRLFFLDYDGTLSPIVSRPEDAAPSAELKEILRNLSEDPRNIVYIISGRDRKALEMWLGDLHLGLSGEHGCFLRPFHYNESPRTLWKDLITEQGLDLGWREKVLELFRKYAEKIPESTIETKEYAVAFHYRRSKKEIKSQILPALRRDLQQLMEEYPTLDVKKGKKSTEARIKNITKGFVVRQILDRLGRECIDFVLCIGDDVTDEDMFAELAGESNLKNVFTCMVNSKGSKASAYIENQSEVIDILGTMAYDGCTGGASYSTSSDSCSSDSTASESCSADSTS